jgi:PAS domain S-box-containing protein
MNDKERKPGRNDVALEQQLRAAQQRMERLEQIAKDSSIESKGLQNESIQELSVALEELHVAIEEIQIQNEQLREAHQSLELERQHFQELFEFAPDGYVVTTIQGVIQSANHASEILLNLRCERMVGKPFIVFVAEADRIHFHDQLNHFAESQAQSINDWETCLKPRDHNPFPASISISAIYDINGAWVGLRWLIRDISDRKNLALKLQTAHDQLESQVEQRTSELTLANALLRQEINDRKQAEREIQKFVSLADNSTELIGMCDMDFVPIYINPAGKQMVGLDNTRQYIETPAQEFFFPEDRDFVINEFFPRVLREGRGEVEIRFRHFKTGEAVWMVYSVFCIRDRHDQSIGLATVSRNISDRKQSEEKIREQAALIDISPDAIMVRDLDCQILFWNKGSEQIYGWTSAEILGMNSRELLSQKSLPQLETALQTIREKGEWRGEFQKVTKFGQKIQIGSRWKLLRTETGQPHAILTIETDITEQKQLEAQFLRAQRLESLGNLASGIAHDLNNILTPILVIAPMLPLNLPPLNERSQQLLNVLDENAKRGADLVKQILTFARGIEGERSLLQVKHLIGEVEQVIRSTFPKLITFARHLPSGDLWLVSANATQLHQVFMNFCVNARDAMPQGGTLNVSVENRVIDETYVQMNLEAKVGSYVAITFEDTGTGISPEHIDRIFEPFFTTKKLGEGTGLGLSTAMGIVKSHSGFMTVSSKVGKGTQFQIFLPAVQATETAPEAIQESIQGHGELILVVDDEANIRETLKLILENQNYQVLLATDGIEAIATYAKHQSDIKAVLIDLMMPTMDGASAIRALQQFNPQVKVIACSGLLTSDSLLNPASIKAFLPKPFTADDLLNTLHRVLKET